MSGTASFDVGLVLDRCFERHDTGPGHPERPERLQAVREALEASGLPARCRQIELQAADDALLSAVHDEAYIRQVAAACAAGEALDGDTTVCAESDRLARLAAGSLVALCRDVAGGELQRGFAAIRPPGHHAERDRAMGFCMFNNVAVAAADLVASQGMRRVFILDWDVHHGNGTQHIFEGDAEIFYASVHQSPLYPGTGASSEVGSGNGKGTTLNCPLAPGAGDQEFLEAIEKRIVPAATEFDPDFVLISAGFDAHRLDPLANLEVGTEAFGRATRSMIDLARDRAEGRLVSVLEGGYDLGALAQTTLIHLRTLVEG